MQTAVDFLSDLEEFQSLLSTHNSKVESYYELLEGSINDKDPKWLHVQRILTNLEIRNHEREFTCSYNSFGIDAR